MKNWFPIFIAVALGGSIESCSTADCSKVVCGLNQVCNNGQCFCRAGYEGDSCATLSAPKFTNNSGTYNVVESCNGAGGNNYTAYILNGSRPEDLIVQNFLGRYNLNIKIVSTIDKRGRYIEVAPGETLGGIQDNIIEGQGNYEVIGTPRITLQLNYRENGVSKSCTHTFYKL